MRHPFLSATAGQRIWLSIVTFVITVTGMAVLSVADPARISGTAAGIVSFELAGSASQARTILQEWGEPGRNAAAFNLGFDYFFILGYSSFAALMCLRASDRFLNPRLITLGVFLAWLQWTVGLLDCTENASLLGILFRGASDSLARIARSSALGKFGLLGCGAIYILFSLLRKSARGSHGRA
jgi:hypothetical protein